jgi:hypothetical protein
MKPEEIVKKIVGDSLKSEHPTSFKLGAQTAIDLLMKRERHQHTKLIDALNDYDTKLRQMRVDGEITMREMIVALKPLMWITDTLEELGVTDDETK